MTLTPSSDPLVWIDCEMTGLDHVNDAILSISCYITDADLNLLPAPPSPSTPTPQTQPGYNATILTPASILQSMGPWCLKTHTATGLIAQCQSPTQSVSASTAASSLLSYIQSYVPRPGVALLAGNSVHVDRLFLLQGPWRPVVDWLHYRVFDVSAVKEAVRRWCRPEVLAEVPRKKLVHAAQDDVWESIEEARFYRRLLGGAGVGVSDRG